MRYLIVNGDDFGLSNGVSRGILETHRRGILTSTSLMVNRRAAAAAAVLAREAPALSVGLHPEFAGPAAADGHAAVAQQLHRFEQLIGMTPTHLDSHHDDHGNPRVLPYVVIETLCDPRVRDAVHQAGICLIGFRDLPAVLASTTLASAGASWRP